MLSSGFDGLKSSRKCLAKSRCLQGVSGAEEFDRARRRGSGQGRARQYQAARHRIGIGWRRRARASPYRNSQDLAGPWHRSQCRGRHLDRCGGRRRLCRRAARCAGAMGARPAAAQYPRLSRHPPQRLRIDRRRQAGVAAGGRRRSDPDRGLAAEIRDRGDRGSHRPRDLAHPWPHGRCDARFLCAARDFLTRAARRPLAGRRRAGQSGAGVGRARAGCGNRDRRQSLQRHLLHDDLCAWPDNRAGNRGRSGAAEARLRPVVFRRAHHEARVLRQRRTAGHLLGHGRCIQHHAGSHHPRAPRRRSAGSADHAPRRSNRLVRFPPRRGSDCPWRARRRARHRTRSRKPSTCWRRCPASRVLWSTRRRDRASLR